jgi:hypothetical protein
MCIPRRGRTPAQCCVQRAGDGLAKLVVQQQAVLLLLGLEAAAALPRPYPRVRGDVTAGRHAAVWLVAGRGVTRSGGAAAVGGGARGGLLVGNHLETQGLELVLQIRIRVRSAPTV